MTNLEYLETLSFDDFVQFLGQVSSSEPPVWEEWISNKFCSSCPPIESSLYGRLVKVHFCEVSDLCPSDLPPSEIGDIALWLRSEKE